MNELLKLFRHVSLKSRDHTRGSELHLCFKFVALLTH